MAPQAYKVVSTHAHEISGWKNLSRLIHARVSHIGGMNCGVQYDLSTMAFKNGEKLECFHRIILRLQQEIILSGENLSPKILIFQYMKALSKRYKIKSFIVPKMTDLITFLYNNRKPHVYTGGNIHGIYSYL